MKKLLLYIMVSSSLLIGMGVPMLVAAQTTLTPCPHGTSANGGCDLGYTPLEPIPGLTDSPDLTNSSNLPTIINAIFKIFITVGALLAVLMLTIGGIQYMVSPSAEMKNEGINRAKAALWGIVLIAASWLILYTINPKLLEFNLNPCPNGAVGCTITGGVNPNSSGSNNSTNTTPDPNGNTISAVTGGAASMGTINYDQITELSNQLGLQHSLGSLSYLLFDPNSTDPDVKAAVQEYNNYCENSGVFSSLSLGYIHYTVKSAPGSIFNSPNQTALVCTDN